MTDRRFDLHKGFRSPKNVFLWQDNQTVAGEGRYVVTEGWLDYVYTEVVELTPEEAIAVGKRLQAAGESVLRQRREAPRCKCEAWYCGHSRDCPEWKEPR